MQKTDDFDMVIILGAARSGTTMLSNLLRTPENVVYIGEPKYFWETRNANHGHDMLLPKHLNPQIGQIIRSKFSDYLDRHGGEILLEKTPSNALRFEFVYNVFPNAKFIHIIRDGRNVVPSAMKRWCGQHSTTEKRYHHPKSSIKGNTKGKIRQKVNRREFRLVDIVRNLDYILPLYLNNIGWIEKSIWGPRFPGIKEAFRELDLAEVCALQWKYCVESILQFSRSERFKGNYFEIRYEEIVAGDDRKIREMFDFAGLSYTEKSEKVSEYIRSRYKPSEKRLTEEELHLIHRHCRLLLEKLGYDDPVSGE
ncbi:MAG: hypothetical protein GVY02_05385 [Bacteroidetes bacterium]|jgi:hypothetical protein|nr:hypothetical protein [Bacteroidota bacterium]